MSSTLEVTDYAEDWSAACPGCRGIIKPPDFPCPSCRTGSLNFFRDYHESNGARWGESGLVCPGCRLKFKSFPCTNGCRAIITVPCISALIACRDFYTGNKRSLVGFIILGAFLYVDFKVTVAAQNTFFGKDGSILLPVGFIGSAFAASVLISKSMPRLFPSKSRKRYWVRFNK